MKYTPKDIVSKNRTCTIPLYQRLFEWNKENVEQLLDDLKRSFLADKNADYYIGMLTATCTIMNGNHLQLVDGQQRFTVMTLIGCVMQNNYYNEWEKFLKTETNTKRLSFVSRKSDEMYLDMLINKDYEYNGELVNPKMRIAIKAIHKYMTEYAKINKQEADDYAKYVYEHTNFFIVPLPSAYAPVDLNKYFERMNSSGKNLEQHEILKVKMLSKFDGDVSSFMSLWNKIADVDTILIKQKENEKDGDYYSRKTKGLFTPADSFSTIVPVSDSDQDVAGVLIKNISPSELKPRESSHYNNGMRCVLRFPQLLLQVLYYYKKSKDPYFSPNFENFFNQSNLLDTFMDFLPYEGEKVNKDDLKGFFEMLIHCRVALDVAFVRSLEYGYTLDMNINSKENSDLKTLLMFESFLYVSSSNMTNYRWFGWLMDVTVKTSQFPSCIDLFHHLKSECDKLNPLPKYNDLCYDRDIRYWFWRLDFAIWEQRKELFKEDEDSVLLDVAENYVFIRNRSIEHIAPQHPKNESDLKWDENDQADTDLRNSFGNLVMISQGLNSALSNSSYEIKKAHVESYFKSVNGTIESLKLLMVYKDCKIGWNKDMIPKHGHEMYELFKKEIPLIEELQKTQ